MGNCPKGRRLSAADNSTDTKAYAADWRSSVSFARSHTSRFAKVEPIPAFCVKFYLSIQLLFEGRPLPSGLVGRCSNSQRARAGGALV